MLPSIDSAKDSIDRSIDLVILYFTIWSNTYNFCKGSMLRTSRLNMHGTKEGNSNSTRQAWYVSNTTGCSCRLTFATRAFLQPSPGDMFEVPKTSPEPNTSTPWPNLYYIANYIIWYNMYIYIALTFAWPTFQFRSKMQRALRSLSVPDWQLRPVCILHMIRPLVY